MRETLEKGISLWLLFLLRDKLGNRPTLCGGLAPLLIANCKLQIAN